MTSGQSRSGRVGCSRKGKRHSLQVISRMVPAPALALLLAILSIAPVLLLGHQVAHAAAAATCTASVMTVVAHEDDSLLFQSPDLLHAIQNGSCVRSVYVTAGDAGSGMPYAISRENGVEAAYAEMAGVADNWTQSDAGVSGHPMVLETLAAKPNISTVFMRLPDGNFNTGAGYSSTGFESLQKLWGGTSVGTISTIHAIDGSTSYTRQGLINALLSLFQSFQPSTIDVQDYVGTFGDGDHSDHHASAYFAREAHKLYTTEHTFVGYMDYASAIRPQNVFGSDLTGKQNAFFTYAQYDTSVCGSVSACSQSEAGAWLKAQYTVGSESGGSGASQTPTATPSPTQSTNVAGQATVTASSQNTATQQTANKAVDGVIDGYPGDYTKEWATVGGGAGSWLKLTWSSAQTLSQVVLFDRPNLNDQITAATLTFSDGTVVAAGTLPNNGSALTTTLSQPVTTTSLLFTVKGVSSNTLNIGLSEIQTITSGS